MTMNGGEYAAERAVEKRQKAVHVARLTRLRDVLRSVGGRAALWDLLEDAGLFRGSFHPESERMSAFNEGRRGFGLQLLSRIEEADSTAFLAMWNEHEKRKAQEVRNERSDADAGDPDG